MASRPALSEPGMPPALPIDPLLPEIVSVLKRSQSLVIIAPPGAGKTTRVPPALLRAQLAGSKEIAILQPRRLPTRLAARRVAEEMGEPLGGLVGYQVRFEEVTGPRTRLRFVTEGVLERKLFSNRRIPEIGLVVLDEFHERHLSGDLCLALLRDLQQRERPDLKLVVMSATLDAEPIAAYLGNCPILRSEGRQFEIDLQHLPAPDPRPIEAQVLASLKRLGAQNEGDALVFLPGAAEIRRTRASWRLAGRGAGSSGSPLYPTKVDPLDQRRGDIGHDRRNHRGDRQRAGADFLPLALVRTAHAQTVEGKQSIRHPAGGTGRPNQTGKVPPPVHPTGLRDASRS